MHRRDTVGIAPPPGSALLLTDKRPARVGPAAFAFLFLPGIAGRRGVAPLHDDGIDSRTVIVSRDDDAEVPRLSVHPHFKTASFKRDQVRRLRRGQRHRAGVAMRTLGIRWWRASLAPRCKVNTNVVPPSLVSKFQA